MSEKRNPWKVYTRHDRVRETLEWSRERASKYGRNTLIATHGFWSELSDKGYKTWGELQNALEQLGPDADPDQVQSIFGEARHITYQHCNECGSYVESVLRLGEDPPEYDYSTIDICFDCLSKAKNKLESAR